MTWNDINTAPRDGTVVLLHIKYEDYPVVGYWSTTNRWRVSATGLEAEGGWNGAIIVQNFDSNDVTHWCPIPPFIDEV